jgi:hypothetical protein
MIVARGREQNGFGLGSQRLGGAGEQHVANDFGARRAARLAREHDLDAERLEPLRQHPGMGGLAATLAAFEGDEASAQWSEPFPVTAATGGRMSL